MTNIRYLTLKEFVLEEINRQLAEAGRDVRIVAERPRPTLVGGEVIELRRKATEATEGATAHDPR